ncbi:helix-turn-helix domain-containing protein [Prosthecobacter sp.]|jgi:hypothetical protein|uniref:helix-turn-helix domain-containing protein n=1 Tax=Prosthecobacter sp. TaxID=1965333 RepID=UPI003783D4DD
MRTPTIYINRGHGDEDQAAWSPNPDWLRVAEACAYSRVSKPKLYDLLNRGLVKSVSLKERGQIKGTRLISFSSLKAFLESRASGGASAEKD